MHNGISQTREPIMTTHKVVEILTSDPLFRANVGQTTPTKRTLRLRLIESIDCQSVVSFGAAKAITLQAFSHILKRSRIDQQSASSAVGGNAESVGVSMACRIGALRPGIDYQLLAKIVTRHDIQSTVWKSTRSTRHSYLRQSIKLSQAGIAKQPYHLFSGLTRNAFEILSAE